MKDLLKMKDPDFVLENQAYIECVAPTRGCPTKPDSVPEMLFSVATKPEKICIQDDPIDKIILRITQVIKDKALGQYENWKSKKWFNPKMPFVIAVNTGDLTDIEDPTGISNVLRALFGVQYKQIDLETGEINFSHRNEVLKTNNEPVPVNYFISQDFSFVSGVLFSNKNVLDHPENLGDDCTFVNNPFAKNPVNELFVRLFKNWIASRGRENDKTILEKNY